ncbi:MAG: aminopeptidase [Myxococcota bacterium]
MHRYSPLLFAAFALAISLGSSGCYLSRVAVGQTRLLLAREPIDSVLNDPETPTEIRERLELVGRAREFATGLGLDVGGQYTSFVAWPGDRIITTVVATRPREVAPAGFWFPVVGKLPYKGFFDPQRAATEAARLREEGMDVCEFGVRAYSTLGWMDDPITGPMLRRESGELLETILHELVHATVYEPNHVDFSEGVANFIGQEGSVRFYQVAGEPERARQRRSEITDDRHLKSELLRFREQVSALYANSSDDPEPQRRALERAVRERIATLPLANQDAAVVASRLRLNDACLALIGTYSSDIERYAARLQQLAGDLPRFVALLEASADADDPKSALLEPGPIDPH